MKEKKKERHFIVIVSGDANDADYITETTFITSAQLPAVQKWFQAMDDFDKEIEKKYGNREPDRFDYCKEFQKWAMGKKDPEMMKVIETMEDYTPRDPGWGEFPHTLGEYSVYELASPDPIDLLSMDLSTTTTTKKK